MNSDARIGLDLVPVPFIGQPLEPHDRAPFQRLEKPVRFGPFLVEPGDQFASSGAADLIFQLSLGYERLAHHPESVRAERVGERPTVLPQDEVGELE